jgi:DNA ligase D-like protein (predicted 3'-phosphoesterase)
MALKSYRDKRDFTRSGEPSGKRRAERKAAGRRGERPIFVIQEHAASSHHFDVRLEVEGVLKSWAVPKGPSTDPAEKRLAVPTEDHPLDYADFEGTIPHGEYGAGTVIVWDKGTWENVTEKDGEIQPASEALEKGHLLFRLDGEKISGGYALQRTGGKDANWLLIKMDDREADRRRKPATTEPKSVQSGRTLEQVSKEAGEKDS